MAWVYLVEYEGYYKIGKTTRTVEERIKGIQTPTQIRIVDRIEIDETLLGTSEKRIHKALEGFNYRNEWFSFEDDIQAIKYFRLAYEHGDYFAEYADTPIYALGRTPDHHDKEYVVSGKSFSTKKGLLLYIRTIHAKDTLSDEDIAFMKDLLIHHRGYERKIGLGVETIEFGTGDFNTKCFVIVRKNGTKEAFSYYVCVNDMIPVPKKRAVEKTKAPESNLQRVSKIKNSQEFWDAYNAAKRKYGKKWYQIKQYFEANPIFIEWKTRRGIA